MSQVVGIEATSLVAVLGAASLAIGLASQGTLSHMAAGPMLLIFRPFRIGDSVEVAGKSGTVMNVNLFMTEIASGDNVRVLIPNGQVWGAALTNLSAYSTRQISVSCPVSVDRDLEALSAALRDWLARDRRVLPSPGPSVSVSAPSDTGAQMSVRAWAGSNDAAPPREDLTKRILEGVRSERSPAVDGSAAPA